MSSIASFATSNSERTGSEELSMGSKEGTTDGIE